MDNNSAILHIYNTRPPLANILVVFVKQYDSKDEWLMLFYMIFNVSQV